MALVASLERGFYPCRVTDLHVTNGDAAAGGLLVGLGCGRAAILVSRDVLSCGPLPALGAFDDWRRQRDRFWAGLVADAGTPEPLAVDPGSSRDLLDNLRALAEADTVTVWVGRALSDQLTLALLVQLAARAGADSARLRVVQFGDEVIGMGALRPEQIAAHPAARPLARAELAALEAAWAAVTAPDPGALLAFLGTAPPSLGPAFERLLHRYPDAGSGLSRWDAELLAHVEPQGTEAFTVLARTLADNVRELDCVGDTYLAWRLARLADPRQPFPALAIDGPLASGRRNRHVRLTAPGLDVRAGRRNHVALNGIDDWVGGVHLQSSAGRFWFRRGDTLVPG
jgi:hypothetical protein